jgi:hypothetical protein
LSSWSGANADPGLEFSTQDESTVIARRIAPRQSSWIATARAAHLAMTRGPAWELAGGGAHELISI